MKKNKFYIIPGLLFMIVLSLSLNIHADEYLMSEVNYSDQTELKIKVGGAQIVFEENSNKIYISEGLKKKVTQNTVYINSPDKKGFFDFVSDEEYKIVIGSDIMFKDIEIDVGGANISGLITSDKIDIDGGGVNITADINTERLKIDGGGVNIDSNIEAEYIEINGAGIKLDLEVKGVEEIELDGAGMTAKIKYLDYWDNERQLSMNGVGGKLNIYLPRNEDLDFSGELDIDTGGIVDVEVDHYNYNL